MEQKAISSDLIRGHIDTIILYALKSGDKYAQQISESIDEKSNNSYQINQATLYSSLKRLENLKFVKSYWNDSDTGRRKYFKLTDSGLNTVEENLSNWSYSRAIIDRLMDCEIQPIYQTKIVEKIVEKPIEKVIENEKIVEVSPAETKKVALTSIETQEINFRNILDGLIKTTIRTTPEANKTQIEIQPLVKNEYIEEQKTVEVQKFNETISAENDSHAVITSGKIDFSDLTLKAAKEGFRLRISSKDSHVEKGNLLVNKLNLFTSTVTFILSIIAVFAFKFSLLEFVNYDTTLFLFTLLLLTVFPLINAINYKLNPLKTVKNKTGYDSFLVSLIIVFNLTLITFAVNLLLNVDFSSMATLAFSLILPIIVYALITMHYLIKCIIINSKICNAGK